MRLWRLHRCIYTSVKRSYNFSGLKCVPKKKKKKAVQICKFCALCEGTIAPVHIMVQTYLWYPARQKLTTWKFPSHLHTCVQKENTAQVISVCGNLYEYMLCVSLYTRLCIVVVVNVCMCMYLSFVKNLQIFIPQIDWGSLQQIAHYRCGHSCKSFLLLLRCDPLSIPSVRFYFYVTNLT